MRRWSLLWHCYVWGGVSCSNGSDDDETSVRLKGNFFISEDEDAEWIYCEDKLTEKESGIWEGEITAVRGWDKFGIEVNGTWYGAEDGLADPETDAKLVKDSNKNFWLATDKGGKSRVTVNLNKMTITVKNTATVDNDNTSGGTGTDDGTTETGGNTTGDDTPIGTDDESNDKEQPATLPTAVTLHNNIDNKTWTDTTMTKSATDGIWTCELTVSHQWLNFNVKAKVGGKDILYSGATGGTEAEVDKAVATTQVESLEKDNIWCNIGEKYNGAQILVTVDFTGDKKTIKITVVKEGTKEPEQSEDEDTTSTSLVTDFSLSSITSDKPGITIAQGTVFSTLAESNTITVTITCNSWSTTDGKDTWFCYCIDGAEWKGNIETWNGSKISTIITGEDITTLKSGSLTIYGNNTDSTVTVTYK